MGEFTIVLGLIILITVMIMYSRSNVIKPCVDYVTYFDKMYYKLPKLRVAKKDSMVSINDRISEVRLPPVTSTDSNFQASRWEGVDSQPSNNLNNVRQNTNNSVVVTPMDLQSGVKSSNYYSQTKDELNPNRNLEGYY